jgi:hypothetical protein
MLLIGIWTASFLMIVKKMESPGLIWAGCLSKRESGVAHLKSKDQKKLKKSYSCGQSYC